MTEDQFVEMLRKVVAEEVKQQLAFYERQLGEIVGMCGQLLEDTQRHDRDLQAVLSALAEIKHLLSIDIDPVTSEVEPRARDRQALVRELAELQRLLGSKYRN